MVIIKTTWMFFRLISQLIGIETLRLTYRILENMGRLLQLIPNRLHTIKELIDRLSGRLFHIDKKTPKLILVREASGGIMTTHKIPNILSIFITTKLLMNGRYSRVAKLSDDLVILAIPIFKTISELCIVFILRTNRILDFTCDIAP